MTLFLLIENLTFFQDIFKSLERDEDEGFELDEMTKNVINKGAKVIGKESQAPKEKKSGKLAKSVPVKSESDSGEGLSDSSDTEDGDDDDGSDTDSDSGSDYDIEQIKPNIKVEGKGGDFEIAPQGKYIFVNVVRLGHHMF